MTPLPDPSLELLDVVNDRDEVIGQAARRDIHARGLNHRAVHVLLFNESGELFLQQRAPTKDRHPLKLDSSASGHLASGEDYDRCAGRELAEELGLHLPPTAFQKLFQLPADAATDLEFVWVYRVTGPYQPVINPDEIMAGAFYSLAAIARLIREHPERFAPSFIKVFDEYRRFG